jgi:hypothetical protein
MTAKPNSLHPKPDYCLHRRIQAQEFNPAVIVADSTNLTTLFGLKETGVISCKGFKTVEFRVVFVGGAVPTVDIQPLEHIIAEDAFTTPTDEGFVVLASTIASIGDGDINEVTIDQGRLFLRLHAVANAPTEIRMYVVGKERAISITGQN